ncbi:MAG: PKD domain-containing protein, partial [Candidatus Thermoplasmatota archaeon]|nr:PKD domain-containing protein [Candidatus Thermoplasmatota archaeon]
GEMWSSALNQYMKTHIINDSVEYKTVFEWELFGDPTLSIRDQSTPPEIPQKPSGPTTGKPDVQLTFNSSTTDVDDDQVYYLFDWGDGEFSEWIGPKNSGQEVTAKHSWASEGDFSIRVKAKDEHGVQSGWSEPFSIIMPKAKNLQLPLLLRLLEKIPLLKLFFNF